MAFNKDFAGLYAKGAVELDRASNAAAKMADVVRSRADGDIEDDAEFYAQLRPWAKTIQDSLSKAKDLIE